MGFFNRKQKSIALNTNFNDLQRKYEKSEEKLLIASRSGNEKRIKAEMKSHHNLEYAMLYSHTPEYYKKIKNIKR